MFIAGEPSGDAHAATVVRALRERLPQSSFEFFGSTGQAMRAAGVEPVVCADELAITGLMEEAIALGKFYRAYRKLRRAGLERRPDAVVLVDWPDFNMRLARAFHRRGLKVIYYISPQLWAWRSYRVRNVRRDVDLVLSILPFEREWYARRGITHVEFVGHPLAGDVVATLDREEFCRKHGLDGSQPVIALLPGSRRKELERNLPLMLKAAVVVRQKFATAQFVVPVARNRSLDEAAGAATKASVDQQGEKWLWLVHGEARDTLAASDVAAVASGTATLEAALLGTPLVIVYKESALNWHTLGRLISVEHYGLPNLIAGERIAPELMQHDFTPENLARELVRLLDVEKNRAARARLRVAMQSLGEGGSAGHAADAILEAVRKWRRPSG